ncbi:MAG: UDP-N-acetylmuramate--L-alanine ligase [Alphaproteobacteria bacterium]
MRAMPKDIGALHFIGIGGIGMSGIAEILHTLGYKVQGSDLSDNANVARLRQKNIKIGHGHRPENILDAEGIEPAAVIVSTAVKNDNAELLEARKRSIPVLPRADMLAELMRLKWAVAVSGTHGKTTTTSMIGQMLEAAGLDPTVINGGIVNAYGTNMRHGEGGWMVVEADESDGSFTRLPTNIAVITNIDPEHMDYYGSFDKVREAYAQFIHNLPFYGYAVLCADHPEVQALIPSVSDRRIITYGFTPQADVQALNIRTNADGSIFDVIFAQRTGGKETTVRDIFLPMLGRHNVQNSLAALAIAHEMKVPVPIMKKAFESFTGVKRRFTKVGETNGVTVIDDYGHHPVEIAAVLETARSAVTHTGGRVIAVMQPHRYTRLQDCFDAFCTCFNEADSVIVADVYAAGEQPIAGADKQNLVEGIRKHGHRDVRALDNRDELPVLLAGIAQPGDYIVCLGAGDITYWAQDLPEQLTQVLDRKQDAA